jgi:hypothetical protein
VLAQYRVIDVYLLPEHTSRSRDALLFSRRENLLCVQEQLRWVHDSRYFVCKEKQFLCQTSFL